MRKEKVLIALLVIAVLGALLLVLAGCAGHRMNLKEMYMAEKISGEPEEVSYYRFILPEILDVPDTALVNFGDRVWPSLSWKAVFRVKNAKGKYELIEGMATRDSIDPRNFLKINVPANIQLKPGDQIFVVDHEQKYIFNALGGFISADYESTDLSKFENFFTRVEQLKLFTLLKGTLEYASAMEFSKRLIGTELIKEAEKVKKELGLPLGVSLNKEQLALVEEKGYDKMFKELLFDKWYLAFAWPVITPETVGGYLFITKIIQIPTYLWREETGPGRLSRPMTAKDWYITNYWLSRRKLATLDDYFNGFKLEETIQISGQSSVVLMPKANQSLPDDIKAEIKGTPFEAAKTYEEYNKCAAEYNRKIMEKK